MDGRGTVCAHCAEAEAEEPCPQCRRAVCISCLLDRAPCRVDARPPLGDQSPAAAAIATLESCGVAVSGERLVGSAVPLWLIESVSVAPLGDPVPGRPDVLTLSVATRGGESVEILRRSEAGAVDEVYAAARALAILAGTSVTFVGQDEDR